MTVICVSGVGVRDERGGMVNYSSKASLSLFFCIYSPLLFASRSKFYNNTHV